MRKSQFVSKLKTRSSGKPMGNPSDLDILPRETFSEIKAGSVTFHIRAKSDYDFFDSFRSKAFFELRDSKVFRFHSVQR